MYKIVSSLSFITRVIICYKTIEQYPIFQDPSINWVVGQIISIYTILWFITYGIVGKISAGNHMSGIEKSIIYFFIYLVFVAIVYTILFILTSINILPIL